METATLELVEIRDDVDALVEGLPGLAVGRYKRRREGPREGLTPSDAV